MTKATPRARCGKMTLTDLLILTVEAGATIGGCFAIHVWMAG